MSIRLYIGNLPKELERQELETLFADESETVSTKVITDRKTGKCRGFGFVTVKTDEQADELIAKYNGLVLKDSTIKLEKALPRTKGKSGEDEGGVQEAESAILIATATPSSNGGGSRRKQKSKKPHSVGSSTSPAPENHQPDPRWAQELEKLKQLLAAQPTAP
ncbi:MAG: RNA recognition motif domain-containing protein [Synechococcales cyanobacterium]